MLSDPKKHPSEDGLWKGDPAFRANFKPFSAALEPTPFDTGNAAFSPADKGLLSGIDLTGLRVTLALGPAVESDSPRRPGNKCDIFPPLYLIQLASFLRAYQAKVAIKDHFVGRHFILAERLVLSDLDRLQAAIAGRCDAGLESLLDRWICKLALKDTDILCLSASVTADPLTFVLLKRRLVSRGRRLPMIVGGYWDWPGFRHPWSREIDHLVSGEGEVPLLLLCDALHRGKTPGTIPGLARYDDRSRRFQQSECTHSLDISPPPDLEGFDLDAYSYRTYTRSRGVVIPYRFIVGCPYDCAYCNLDHKRRFKRRQPELVVRDLLALEDRFHISQFFFLNATFNIGRAYEVELLTRMIQAKRRWRWSDCCRPQGVTEGFLTDMRRAGCDWLNWGLDTSSDRLSRLYGRNILRDDFTRVLKMSTRAGIRNSVNVIIGMPNETDADIDGLLSYLKAQEAGIDHIFVQQYDFIQHSAIGTAPERFGLRRTLDGSGVDEVGGLTWAQRRRWGTEATARVNSFVASRPRRAGT